LVLAVLSFFFISGIDGTLSFSKPGLFSERYSGITKNIWEEMKLNMVLAVTKRDSTTILENF
jgi:hypothetical protein